MAWQGPNYIRDGHVLFPHYHYNNYVWIRDYYAHRYHPQKGIIVDVPTPHADPGSDHLRTVNRSETATDRQTTANTNNPAIPASALELLPALPDAPPYISTETKPLPHLITPIPHPGQARLTPGQLKHHFANIAVPHLAHPTSPALPVPTAQRAATVTTARTERLAIASQPGPEPPRHGLTTSTMLILLALVIVGTAASTYIVGRLFFRILRT